MRGRKPKPSSLKILNGNAGKRPIPKELTIDSGRLEPPKDLLHEKNEVALEEWKRQCPILERCGVYKEIDRPALMAYCFAFQHYVKASEGLRDFGYFIKLKNGDITLNPNVKLQRIYFEQLAKMASEFGMTPVSRVRLSPDNIEKTTHDELSKKIFG